MDTVTVAQQIAARRAAIRALGGPHVDLVNQLPDSAVALETLDAITTRLQTAGAHLAKAAAAPSSADRSMWVRLAEETLKAPAVPAPEVFEAKRAQLLTVVHGEDQALIPRIPAEVLAAQPVQELQRRITEAAAWLARLDHASSATDRQTYRGMADAVLATGRPATAPATVGSAA